MRSKDPSSLERLIAALPHAYAGPGGACAVLHEGKVLVRHAWGWANAERRIAFTPQSLFRMCSVTKQFTCGLALDAFPDLSMLDGNVRDRLPRLGDRAPGARDLAHNQSGLRDYWAMAMLHGAPAESAFAEREAEYVIAGTRTLQFTPGTRYSYANQNFRLLSDIVQDRMGRSFAELLRTRLFEPAGLATALLAADTRAMPDGTEGYEGNPAAGFRPAENRIIWTGDAGLGASLDDMIAWERHIDATRDDEGGLYRRLSTPQCFADGAPAPYGFGLGRREMMGRMTTGHGGALRGWRCHRIHVASERISVVVLFNHMADAHQAASDLLAAMLGDAPASPPSEEATPSWLGAYVEPETGLAVRIDAATRGHVRLRYGHNAELLELRADGTAGIGGTGLRPGPGGLWMDRPQENQSSLLKPCDTEADLPPEGRYHCAELTADLTVHRSGGVAYGGFSGRLGTGRMEQLVPIGGDLWALPCPRALDHTPPGDWTLAIGRDVSGRVAQITVGCWLARNLTYLPLG